MAIAASSRARRLARRSALLVSIVMFGAILAPLLGRAVAFASKGTVAATLLVGVAYGTWGIWRGDRGQAFPTRMLGSEPAVDLSVATLFVAAFAPFIAPLPGLTAILYSFWVLGAIAKLEPGAVAPITPVLFVPGLFALWTRSGLDQPPSLALVYVAIPLLVGVTAMTLTRLHAHTARVSITPDGGLLQCAPITS